MFVSFQQRLLRGVRIGPVEGIARAHAAHGEKLQLARFAAQYGHGFEPIHLRFLAQLVALRHEHFPPAESQLSLPLPHIAPHCGFTDRVLRMLLAQPHPDPMSRMPLFARSLKVRGQHPLDVRHDRTQSGRFAYHRFSLGRNSVPDRLPHHPPVHTVLLG